MTNLSKFLIFVVGLSISPIDATAQWNCIVDMKLKDKLVLQNKCGADMLVSFCIKETTRPFLSDTNCHMVKKGGEIRYEFWITQPEVHDYGYRYTYITPARSGEVERCPPRPDCSDIVSSKLDPDRDSGNSHESEYASALDNMLETNDYQAALGDLDKKAAQRLQRQEEERKRQAAEAKRLEEKRIAKAKRDQAEQERIARLEAEWEAEQEAGWEAEQEAGWEARRRRANSSSGFNTLMNSLSNAINQGTMNAYEKLLQQQQATQQQEANRYTGINGEVCDEILYSKLNLLGNPANKEITRKHLQDAGCKPGAGGIIWLAKMNAWGRNSKSVGGTQ